MTTRPSTGPNVPSRSHQRRPTGRRLAGVLAVAALVVVLVPGFEPVSSAYIKPSPVPLRWELDFEPRDLRLHYDRSTDRFFWYFTYQVTNNTGADRVWAPSFVLFTDDGRIQRSGEGGPAAATESLLDLLGNELMETQNEVIGDLKQGPEHAREGLVIWPARDLEVTELSLFIAGISGETARIINGMTGEPVILRKTMHRSYLVPGDAAARGTEPVDLVDQRWVMR